VIEQQLMSAIAAILRILRTLPVSAVTFLGLDGEHPHVSITFVAEDDVLAAGKAFGVELSYAASEHERWLAGRLPRSPVHPTLYLNGPHVPARKPTEIDAAALAAAIAEAPVLPIAWPPLGEVLEWGVGGPVSNLLRGILVVCELHGPHLEIRCQQCNEMLCHVEAGDSLWVLADVARDHRKMCRYAAERRRSSP
jgi:hypothetical protein